MSDIPYQKRFSTISLNENPAAPISHHKKSDSFTPKTMTVLIIIGIAIAVYLFRKPDTYYTPPLAFPTQLAATFGEVRQDHFHLGVDIRTGGKENLPVYALADGYISRISIQPDGYGKALYIAYNNGITSVFAHLNRFTPKIDSVLSRQQHLQESWEQEMFLPPHQFPVTKGQLVAYSGNSGFSEGPHLHVEFRNTKTKSLINPVIAGMPVDDDIPPKIKSAFLYNGTNHFYEGEGKEIRLTKDHRNVVTPVQDVSDSVLRVGIEAEDWQRDSKRRLGIYQALLFLDNKLQFEFRMDSIPFLKDRYVNATIDYPQWIRKKRCIQLLSALPGNRLPSWQQTSGNGLLHLDKERTHEIRIVVKDASGNRNSVRIPVRYRPSSTKIKFRHTAKLLVPGKAGNLNTTNAAVYFSPYAFYDTVQARMEEIRTPPSAISSVISLFDPSVPVHTSYVIQLKTTLSKNDVLRDCVLMELHSGSKKQYYKGDWSGDYMTGKFNRFGKIRLVLDTQPPVVHCDNWKRGTFTKYALLRLHCLDNYGQVEHFRGEIDGRWVPFERKGNEFVYRISEHLSKGKHRLWVSVEDKAGNKKCAEFVFVVQ